MFASLNSFIVHCTLYIVLRLRIAHERGMTEELFGFNFSINLLFAAFAEKSFLNYSFFIIHHSLFIK